MIRDTSDTNKRPGERIHGNAVAADIASLERSRAFAIEEQKKGKDRSALIAHYDTRLAHLKNFR